MSHTHFRSRRRSSGSAKHGHLLVESLEPRVLLTSSPTGSIDLFSRSYIVGWALNADDGAAPVSVDITINGVKTTISANQSRADLAGPLGSPIHAFTYAVPTLVPGNSTVLVEAVSPSTGVRTTLKSGTLTNPQPIYSIDVANSTTIAGWALDADSANPINIRVDIDGVTGTPFATNRARPDVGTIYHVNNTGFLATGSFTGHVVEIYAMDAPSNQATLIYSNNHLPTGSLDVASGFFVYGWARDIDNPTASINVRVDIDGQTLGGTPTLANVSRSDLTIPLGSANHGFNIAIPGLTPGTHTIQVYAIDGQSGSAAPVLIGTKVVTNAAPIGHVDTVNSSVLSGWALDPDIGANPVTINVYVDDTSFGSFTANGSRPDLTKPFGSPNHGFAVNLSTLPAGSHSITVTAVDDRTSDESEVVIFDDFINNHVPIGSFDAINGKSIAGWAYDQDAPSMALPVDVYVDGVFSTTLTAGQARADVDQVLGSPNHAFSGSLPAMSFGTHKIDLYASESQGNVSVLIGSKTVVNSRPIGWIESATATNISGWAGDPNRPGESVDIVIYINGVAYTPGILTVSGTANISRPDVAAIAPFSSVPGYALYGFNITLPTLSAGRNQIDIYAVDKNNGMISPLGSRAITVA